MTLEDALRLKKLSSEWVKEVENRNEMIERMRKDALAYREKAIRVERNVWLWYDKATEAEKDAYVERCSALGLAAVQIIPPVEP